MATLILLLVWVGALAALALSLWFYRWARPPSDRHRLTVGLSIVGTILAVFGLAVTGEWLLGLAALPIFLAYVFAVSAWAWKVDHFVEKRLEKRLAMSPAAREAIERNAILGMFRKKKF